MLALGFEKLDIILQLYYIEIIYIYIYYSKNLAFKANQISLVWPKNMYTKKINFIAFLKNLY